MKKLFEAPVVEVCDFTVEVVMAGDETSIPTVDETDVVETSDPNQLPIL